jgi:hypothetical protein
MVEERLEPSSRTCSHRGREQYLIREEASERLDLIPAQLIRLRTCLRCRPAARTRTRARSRSRCPLDLRERIRRGVFKSVDELIAAIDDYIENNNRDPKPIVWTATAELIPARINSLCIRTNRSPH